MQREFLLNILFLVFINLLIKPFFIFGIDRTIQNQVGLEEYGMYVALFNFTFLVSIVNDFGIQSFNNQRVAQDHQLLQRYFSNIFVLKISLGILYTLLVLILAAILGYTADYYHLLFFFILNQILLSAILFFRSNISALGMYRTDSLMTIVERVVLIVICSILLWANPFSTSFQIEWFVYAQTCSLFITAIIGFSIVYQQLHTFRLQFNPNMLWELLKNSAPFALVIFLMTVYTRVDFVMIERLLPDGKKAAGIYASAYRLLDAVNIIGLLFSGLLLPMFAKSLKANSSIIPLLQVSARLLFFGTILTAISVCFFRIEIMELLYTHTDVYAANVLGILIFTFIMVGGGYIFGTLLLANNSLKQLNKLFLISVLLNIGSNFYCIPRWGALGAAGTTLITQGVAFIGQILIARKVFDLKTDWVLIRQLVGFIILIIGITSLAYYHGPFVWIGNLLLVLVGGIGAGFAVGLLNKNDFFSLLENRQSKY